MDKKTFLAQLEKSLRILKEEELQDIISEYEQHIDMKVSKGLTEEEAIADFGSLEELKAEILAAYHVRADYEVEQPGKIIVESCEAEASAAQEEQVSGESRSKGFKAVKEYAGKLLVLLGSGTKSGWHGLRRMTSWCLGKIKGIGIWFWNKLCGLVLWCRKQMLEIFGWHKQDIKIQETEENSGESCKAVDEVGASSKIEETTAKAARDGSQKIYVQKKRWRVLTWPLRAIKGVWAAMVSVFNWAVAAAWWCIRVGWNIWWVGVSVLLGFFSLMCLFALGVLVVLWAQGYPLAGFTIVCFGLALCLLSAAAFGFTLLCRVSRKSTEMAESEVRMEGEQYA